MNLPAGGDCLLGPSRERLLACLSTATEPSRVAEIEGLSAADWAAIAGQAVMMGIGPLLYHRLKELGPRADVPPQVRRGLREA